MLARFFVLAQDKASRGHGYT